MPEELGLPFDHPRPPVVGYRGATVPLHLDAELHGRLLELARSGGASLFMVIQAGLAATLARMGAGEDIPIGCPVAGRGESALDDLVGFFVNTLVLRTDASGDPSFRQLLGRVCSFALEAYGHPDVPFERVVEALQPTRSLARHPLFQVALLLQNAPDAELTLPGLAIQPEPFPWDVAKFDLTLGLSELRGLGGEPMGIEGGLEYNLDLFEKATAEAMAARIVRFLKAAAASPDLPLHRLEILDPDERRLLLQTSDAAAYRMPDATLPALFEARAASAPGAAALVHRGRELTYAELDARADRLARRLAALGAGPDSVVGVSLPRSFAMVAAFLAVLKAGAAYLPLDPDDPPARRALMLRDAGASILLAPADATPLAGHDARAVNPDADAEPDPGDRTPTPPRVAVGPDDLAYVMFTSGSTGRPKGVAVPHRAIVRLLLGAGYARLDASRTLLQLSAPSFDASTFELWGALLHGGRCVLSPARVPSAAELGRTIDRDGVDTLWLTAAHFNAVVDEDPAALAPLEQLLIGGEALSAAHVRRFLAACPRTRLVNGYGPTEGTTFSCCWQIPAGFAASRASVPIGRPIGGTRAYVLDARLEPAPAGAAGELYIAGAGLARGYAGRPGATAERFVADPFGGPGSRMYRSGDLARWRGDGELEFLGRADRQLKLRGRRIEPGEVEAALARHAAVGQAAVEARQGGAGGRRLVAYVTAAPGAAPDPAELRRHLAERLPAYMVPAAFVVLRSLPLTANGKLDRIALPDPDDIATARPGAYEAPRNPTELQMAAIWSEVLQRPRIGIHDDFFDLGGHSLLVLRLMSLIRRQFNQHIAPLDLFHRPTIADLSELVAPRPDPGRPGPPSGHAPTWWARLASALSPIAEAPRNLRSQSAGRSPLSIDPKPAAASGRGGSNGRASPLGHDTRLVPIQPDGSSIPLFLVPPPGILVLPDVARGDAQFSYYSRLIRTLGDDQPVYGLRILGGGHEPESWISIEQLAGACTDVVRSSRPRGPYLVVGDCVGGIFAYEIARELAAGSSEVILVLLDTIYPDGSHGPSGGSPRGAFGRVPRSRRKAQGVLEERRRPGWCSHDRTRIHVRQGKGGRSILEIRREEGLEALRQTASATLRPDSEVRAATLRRQTLAGLDGRGIRYRVGRRLEKGRGQRPGYPPDPGWPRVLRA